MPGEALTLLLALDIQAIGQRVLGDVARGLEGITAAAGPLAPAIDAIGVALVGIGAVGGVLGVAAKKAADWQTTITDVANNTNMSNAQMKAMSDTILTMAKTTSAPLNQLAEGYMHITNMGFRGADATNVLKYAMESAVSTGGNTAQVANVLAQAMHEFGMSGNEAANAMDILHTAAAEGNMTIETLTNSFGPVAAIASTVGVSLSQAAAAMAALTRHGFNAAEAATQVKNFIGKLVAPTKAAQKEIAYLAKTTGVDLTSDFSQAGLASKGLTGVLADIARATGGNVQAFSLMSTGAKLTTSQLNSLARASHGDMAALHALDPNIRGLYAEFILSGRGAGDYLAILNDINASTSGAGITARSYARTQHTLNFALQTVKNSIDVMLTAIGTKFLPQLTDLAIMVNTQVIPAIARWASGIVAQLLPVLARLPQIVQGQVVPAIMRFAGYVQKNVIPAILEFATYAQKNLIPAILQASNTLVTQIIPAMQRFADYVQKSVLPTVSAFAEFMQKSIIPAVIAIAANIKSQLLPAFNAIVSWVKGNKAQMALLAAALTAIATAVLVLKLGMIALQVQIAITTTLTKAVTAAQWLWNAALDANPIGLIILAIAAFAGAMIYLYNTSTTARRVIDEALANIRDGILALNIVANDVFHAVGGYYNWLGGVANQVVTAMARGLDFLARKFINFQQLLFTISHGLVGSSASQAAEARATLSSLERGVHRVYASRPFVSRSMPASSGLAAEYGGTGTSATASLAGLSAEYGGINQHRIHAASVAGLTAQYGGLGASAPMSLPTMPDTGGSYPAYGAGIPKAGAAHAAHLAGLAAAHARHLAQLAAAHAKHIADLLRSADRAAAHIERMDERRYEHLLRLGQKSTDNLRIAEARLVGLTTEHAGASVIRRAQLAVEHAKMANAVANDRAQAAKAAERTAKANEKQLASLRAIAQQVEASPSSAGAANLATIAQNDAQHAESLAHTAAQYAVHMTDLARTAAVNATNLEVHLLHLTGPRAKRIPLHAAQLAVARGKVTEANANELAREARQASSVAAQHAKSMTSLADSAQKAAAPLQTSTNAVVSAWSSGPAQYAKSVAALPAQLTPMRTAAEQVMTTMRNNFLSIYGTMRVDARNAGEAIAAAFLGGLRSMGTAPMASARGGTMVVHHHAHVSVGAGAVHVASGEGATGDYANMVGHAIAGALDEFARGQMRVPRGASTLLPGAVGP